MIRTLTEDWKLIDNTHNKQPRLVYINDIDEDFYIYPEILKGQFESSLYPSRYFVWATTKEELMEFAERFIIKKINYLEKQKVVVTKKYKTKIKNYDLKIETLDKLLLLE